METAIFKITQESLTNVFRHASARKATVRLEEQDGRVSVSIIDDGKGLSEDLVALRPGSYGIAIIGIKQRVQDHCGLLVLRSANPGTVVEVSIPIKNGARNQPISTYSSRA